MSNSYVFPYGITLRGDGKIETFPSAEISFLTREKEWLTLFLVIDSGATISALPKSDAEVLGIDVERGKTIDIYRVGTGPTNGWVHKVEVRIRSSRILLPIVFLDSDFSPRILGRKGIFNKFMIIFDESKQKTGLLQESSQKIKSVRRIIEKV